MRGLNWSCDLRANEKLGRKRLTYSMTELTNYEGDCRTAPTTPGLLKILMSITPSICNYIANIYRLI